MTGKLIVKDVKGRAEDGGASIANGVSIRALNTVSMNTIAGASLATNRITLPAGDYLLRATAPASCAANHKAYAYNVTDSAVIADCVGTSGRADANHSSSILGKFTIAATKVIEIRHYTQGTGQGDGLGSVSSAPSNMSEVFTIVEIDQL